MNKHSPSQTIQQCFRHLIKGRAGLLPALFLVGCVYPGGPYSLPVPDSPTEWTARYFISTRHNPLDLRIFLQEMPKGADLHNHLSGSVYAEDYISWGAEDGLCIDIDNYQLRNCTSPDDLTVAEAIVDRDIHRRLIDALSVRNFKRRDRSGHQQFFSTFEAFGVASSERYAEMLADVLATASYQNIVYLELMTSPRMGQAMSLANELIWDSDLEAMYNELNQGELSTIVQEAHGAIEKMVIGAHERLGCVKQPKAAGCEVEVRFLAQVIRTVEAPAVFAQVQFGAILARESSWVVGLNLVASEDDPITLRDYTKQMQAVGFAKLKSPGLKVSLHAGELTLGLVPPRDLRFHIWEAVEIAQADRIGHGIDVIFERNPQKLFHTLRERDVLVEINLTSNAVILGVEGEDHPFRAYLREKVPVALSSDDYGVLRHDLTEDYVRAVESYSLSYSDLKELSYNGVRYAFYEDKEKLIGELDRRFVEFESRFVDFEDPSSPPYWIW